MLVPIETAISSPFTVTVLLHNQSNSYASVVCQSASPKRNTRHSSQVILSEGLNVFNRNSSKKSRRRNAAFPGRVCPGNS